jgi:hypothetical protein
MTSAAESRPVDWSVHGAALVGDEEERDGHPLQALNPAVVIPGAVLKTQGAMRPIGLTADLDA